MGMVTPSIPVETPGAKWLYLSLGRKVRTLPLTAVMVTVWLGSKSVVAIAICTALQESEAASDSALLLISTTS